MSCNTTIWLKKENPMKYRNVVVFCVIASLFLLFVPQQTVTAVAGTTVTLRVPNLPSGGWGEPQDRIRSILTSIEGVLKYNLHTRSFTVTITFDDAKTSVDKIIEQLSRGGYPISGEPQWVKWFLSTAWELYLCLFLWKLPMILR